MRIPPLPQAEPDQQPNREPELVPGSARFRKDLESLAGIAKGERELEVGEDVLGKGDAPKVKFRTGKIGAEEASPILLDVDKILAGLEAEEVLDGIGSGQNSWVSPRSWICTGNVWWSTTGFQRMIQSLRCVRFLMRCGVAMLGAAPHRKSFVVR